MNISGLNPSGEEWICDKTCKGKDMSDEKKHCDVLVIGAGPAGIAASIQAARAGSRCILAEKNGMPGGTITAAGISTPGLFAVEGRQIIGGIGWELITKTRQECGETIPDLSLWDPVFWKNEVRINPLVFAAVCDREMTAAGIDLRYHTMLGALVFEADKWKAKLCGKEGLYDVEAEVVIDCTGDANAVAIAGLETVIPDVCQPATYSVHLSGTEGFRQRKELALTFEEQCKQGAIRPSDLGWGTGYSTLFIERRGVNANHVAADRAYESKGRTRAEIEGRASVLRAWHFLRQYGDCPDLKLDFAGSECGIRESRTIRGETSVSDKDYQDGRIFPDALCYGWYPMDRHEFDRINAIPLETTVFPTVPRGAMLPRRSRRIAAAGRIIDAAPGAIAGLRVQAVCFATGQACGAMAHLTASSGVEIRDLPLEKIRKLLRRHGAIVPGDAASESGQSEGQSSL